MSEWLPKLGFFEWLGVVAAVVTIALIPVQLAGGLAPLRVAWVNATTRNRVQAARRILLKYQSFQRRYKGTATYYRDLADVYWLYTSIAATVALLFLVAIVGFWVVASTEILAPPLSNAVAQDGSHSDPQEIISSIRVFLVLEGISLAGWYGLVLAAIKFRRRAFDAAHLDVLRDIALNRADKLLSKAGFNESDRAKVHARIDQGRIFKKDGTLVSQQ